MLEVLLAVLPGVLAGEAPMKAACHNLFKNTFYLPVLCMLFMSQGGRFSLTSGYYVQCKFGELRLL